LKNGAMETGQTFSALTAVQAWNKLQKRQRTAALQDAVATNCKPLFPRGLGMRLSSAAFNREYQPSSQWLFKPCNIPPFQFSTIPIP